MVTDVDGNADERDRTVSVFNGPDPTIKIVADEENEISTVAAWLTQLQKKNVQPHEIGLFVHSADLLARARRAVEAAKMKWSEFKVYRRHGPQVLPGGSAWNGPSKQWVEFGLPPLREYWRQINRLERQGSPRAARPLP